MYDLFSDFFDGFSFFPESTVYKEEAKCPVCGRTYRDFQATGKLGCGKCYEIFSAPLSSTLRQLHGNPVHNGKIPSACGRQLRQKRHLEELKAKLSAAVKAEDYEAAAKLHKEIREIESRKD